MAIPEKEHTLISLQIDSTNIKQLLVIKHTIETLEINNRHRDLFSKDTLL